MAAATLVLAAACGTSGVERAQLAQTALVGLPKSELLSCAGAPNRSRQDAGREYYTYESETIYGGYGPSFGLFGGTDGMGVGIGLPLGMGSSADFCEATFTIESDRVVRVDYNAVGGYGGPRVGECARIVEGCLAATGAAPAPES
jgi:hypothetical protein